MQPRGSRTISFPCIAITLLSLVTYITPAFGGESKIGEFVGWAEISCCMSAGYTVEVENINPNFAIQGIIGTFEVRRGGSLVHSQTLQGPTNAQLTPGQKFNFEMEVPEEITLLDGLLDFKFLFDSNFDLNPDPTRSTTVPVTGCGILINEAIEHILDYINENYEDFLPEDAPEEFETLEEALVYYYPDLLKPNTEFKDPFGDLIEVIDAFSFLFMVDWFPYERFEKPVTLLTLNTNTLEVSTVESQWYPVVFEPGSMQGMPFVMDPFVKADKIIRGIQPQPEPPPFPLISDPVPSVPADSVCAILISGFDNHDPANNQSFVNDAETMQRYLTSHEKGPRLPESAILRLHGVSKDSLRVHLAALKDKYKKVYLYFSGHGSKTGQLCLGMAKADWMTSAELMDELYNSNAENLTIILDCCYAGKILQPACDDPRIKMRNIELYTSSDDVHRSGNRWHFENGMKVKRGVLTSQMFNQSLDETRDVNRDGKISLCESFEGVVMSNPYSILTLQNPQKKVEYNATFAWLAPIFKQAVVDIHGQDVADAANLRIYPELLGAGVDIHSFDMETMITTPELGYFGWIDFGPEDLYAKPVELVIIHGETYTVILRKPAEFWPVISTMPGFDPFSPIYLINDNTPIFLGPVANTIHTAAAPVDPGDRVCALIVTGNDPRPGHRDAMSAGADIVRGNLMGEELGPRLPLANIRVEKFITADSLRAILASMQGKYDKVYFYYMGHGDMHGRMFFGKSSTDWISYADFLEALDDVGASENCVIIEACHSGLIQEALKSSGTFYKKSIEIYTSSSADKRTKAFGYLQDGQLSRQGIFGLSLMKCYGDPAAEKDGRTGTSLREAFEWMAKMNPQTPKGRLMQLQCPTYYGRDYFHAKGSETTLEDLWRLDLRVKVRLRTPAEIDLTADVLFNFTEKSSTDENVFAISPVREWQLTGELSADVFHAIDLEFLYDTELDTVDSEEGVLGLVRRTDSSADWEAYYPAYYDSERRVIVAEDVTGPGQWTIARVVDMSSSLQELHQIFTDFSISPNPVSNGTAILHVNTDSTLPLKVACVSLNGVVCKEIYHDAITGALDIPIDTEALLPGIYYIRLTSGSITGSLPLVIR